MAGKWQDTVYGPFPCHFRVASLSELCDGQRGIQTGPFGSQLHSKDYVSTGTPIATVEHLGENRIIHHNLPLVSDYDRDRLSKYVLRKGDILFSRVGAVDRRGLVRKAEEGWLFSGRCLRVRPNPERIDPVYLSYFFGLWAFKEFIRSIAVGATMPSLNTHLLCSVPIVYPPLSEQRAIADVLGTLDDKIELNRRMNETLEEMARALFKSWFVDFDPVRAKVKGRWWPGESLPGLPAELYDMFPHRLVDSQLGPIPEGWTIETLGDVMDVNPRRRLKKGQVAAYLSMANMPTRGSAPSVVGTRPFGSGTRFINGDTLIARITPCLENGKTAYVNFLKPGEIGWGSTEYIVIRSQQPLPDIFAYCLARENSFREYAIKSMSGSSGRQRVALSAVKDYLVAIPADANILRVFAGFCKPLFTLVAHHMRASTALINLRQALLPILMMGRLKVSPTLESNL